MTHTSIFKQHEDDKAQVALNMIELIGQWMIDQGEPKLAKQMVEEFTVPLDPPSKKVETSEQH